MAPQPPIRTPLPGGRWRLGHGPIDVILFAEGDAALVAAAHEAAWQRLHGLLAELVAELPLLRRPVDDGGANPLRGAVARRMWQACATVREAAGGVFITPMAAVAGAVAEELLAPFRRDGIRRAWANNGGDIALHVAAGEALRVGVVADISRHRGALDGRFEVRHADPVRGVATSGWRGRSQSLGIADSVTVLAGSAALADAAATLVANAVNAEHAAIERRPANTLRDDSDLGDRLVTTGVPPLPPPLVAQALAAGRALALRLRERGCLHDAALLCQGQAAGCDTAPASGLPLAA